MSHWISAECKRRDDLPAVPVALVAPRAWVLALPPHPPPAPRVGDLHRLPVLALEQVTDLAEGGQGPPARLELARARHAVAAAVHPQQRAHHLRDTTETAVSTLVDMPPSNRGLSASGSEALFQSHELRGFWTNGKPLLLGGDIVVCTRAAAPANRKVGQPPRGPAIWEVIDASD